MMMLCFSLTAEVKIEKDRFGTVTSIVYTGYVLDGKHAQQIAAKYVGKRPWVGNGKLYRSGNMFLIIGKTYVIITASHEMAMTANVYSSAKRRAVPNRMKLRFGNKLVAQNSAFSREASTRNKPSAKSTGTLTLFGKPEKVSLDDKPRRSTG
jgi:hypothetical protein